MEAEWRQEVDIPVQVGCKKQEWANFYMEEDSADSFSSEKMYPQRLQSGLGEDLTS